jgi:hypothetical protein
MTTPDFTSPRKAAQSFTPNSIAQNFIGSENHSSDEDH